MLRCDFKEDATDTGRSRHGWTKLDVIVRALGDNELNVLDHFEQNNPNKWSGPRREQRSGSSIRRRMMMTRSDG